jgi:predicted Fe-Mo cluster-binding NifX family protein
MKVAFPVNDGSGLESEVFGHFGSASGFVIVDMDSGSHEKIDNMDLNHSHNNCNPLKAIDGRKIDAVVSGGIGQGALTRLRSLGIKVFRSEGGTVAKNVELFKAGSLAEFMPGFVCSGHSGDGGCAHH